MKKELVLKEYLEATKKVSDITRNLSMVGIAVIWIFNRTDTNVISIPNALVCPAIYFIGSLLSDLLQYVYSGFAYYLLFHRGKVYTKNEIQEIKKPAFINVPKWILYSIKISCVIIGYILLLGYLKYLLN